MNRDAILATIIGFGIGLLVTGVIVLGPGLIKQIPNMQKLTLPTISWPTPAPKSVTPTAGSTLGTAATNQETPLIIDSPLPDAIENDNEILVSGKTTADSLVIVETGSGTSVSQANQTGKYAGKITLSEGKNEIIVTSYTRGKPQTRTVVVYYTEESL